MRKIRKIRTIVLIAFLLLLAGCQKSVVEEAAPVKKEIVIPATFLINPITSQSENKDIVNQFNEAYKGIYRVEVEWLTETAAGYRTKIKQLNAIDQLPAIITDAGFDADFYELLIANHRLVNLAPYMQESKAWTKAMQADIRADCTERDGAIYLSPLGNSVSSYAGIIYHKELFAQAGITSFPTTWEDFIACLVQLEDHNITPLALHGSGSYWSPMLFATSYIAQTEEGNAFLAEQFPKDYNRESMKQLLQVMKTLYEYTYADALDIPYNEAEQRFLKGEAAMVANGYWMLLQMNQQEEETFGFALFPGQTLMASPRMSAWAVTAGYDDEITKGAVEFLKFRILKNQEEAHLFMKAQTGGTIIKEYRQAIQEVEKTIPNYQLKWEQKVQNDFFTEKMPLFLQESLTQETFIQELNEYVEKISAEK